MKKIKLRVEIEISLPTNYEDEYELDAFRKAVEEDIRHDAFMKCYDTPRFTDVRITKSNIEKLT